VGLDVQALADSAALFALARLGERHADRRGAAARSRGMAARGSEACSCTGEQHFADV
jgi:hypothetical protein